ncbi:unnamed protein product [Oikopleura dioica]|uniref:Uncharacterized protein n=1 Tax=Oikopleura dioica TaxID=34765 RepID=E4Y2I3_OIKDI|nr:unnamed protein product [Oikopleura dioica]
MNCEIIDLTESNDENANPVVDLADSESDDKKPSPQKKGEIIQKDDSTSNDDSTSDNLRLFRRGSDIPASGREKLKTRKRQIEDTNPEKKKKRSFGKVKTFDPATANVKNKLDPLIIAFKAHAISSKKDKDLEEVIKFEKNEAREKYDRMSDEMLVKKGSKFGIQTFKNFGFKHF